MILGGLFATLLAALCLWNRVRRPAALRLAERNRIDYAADPLDRVATELLV
jgi:hypothetical protein